MRSLALRKLLPQRSFFLLKDLEQILNKSLTFRSKLISLPATLAPGPAVTRIPTEKETSPLTTTPQTGPQAETTERAICRISTFKRKKIKVRKDRARTVRRKIRRKSHKKRAKFKL